MIQFNDFAFSRMEISFIFRNNATSLREYFMAWLAMLFK